MSAPGASSRPTLALEVVVDDVVGDLDARLPPGGSECRPSSSAATGHSPSLTAAPSRCASIRVVAAAALGRRTPTPRRAGTAGSRSRRPCLTRSADRPWPLPGSSDALAAHALRLGRIARRRQRREAEVRDRTATLRPSVAGRRREEERGERRRARGRAVRSTVGGRLGRACWPVAPAAASDGEAELGLELLQRPEADDALRLLRQA